MSQPLSHFDSLQLDVLKEVGNIGAGHAATALSLILKSPVDMNVPLVKLLEFNKIPDFVGGAEQIVVTVFLRVEGDIKASIFFILTIDSAKDLLRNVANTENRESHFSEYEISALKETANILTGSYLSSLADFTGLRLYPTVPELAIDMAGALIMHGLMEIGQYSDYALVIDTSFFHYNKAIAGHFFLIPDPEAFQRLFESLGVPIE